MKDFYKQEIEKVAMEKIAARAWKKYLPKLNDINYNRLLESGVYNPNRELKGLRRGTQNILNKYDAKMIRKPNKAGAATAEMVKRDAKVDNIFVPNDEINYYKNMPKDKMFAFSGIPSSQQSKTYNATGKKGGFSFVPKNSHNKKVRANPEESENFGIKTISRRDRDGRKWHQAITERHEADEVRYGTINYRKGIGEGASYESHISPKVLSQESANMGTMPRTVKNQVLKKHRNNYGEAQAMESITGVPYASSGVYNKKAAKKLENYMINYNKANE